MKVIQEWMQLAASRHLKVGERFLTPEECDLILQVLQAVSADLEFSQQTGA